METRIKEIRKYFDLTQQAFADRIGIKRNTIANYESGRNIPIDAVISLICKEFGINEEWLRTGQGEMFNKNETFSLDDLVEQYNLSDLDKEFMKLFMKLDKNTRDSVYNLFRNLFVDTDDTNSIPSTPQELEKMYETFQNPDTDSNVG